MKEGKKMLNDKYVEQIRQVAEALLDLPLVEDAIIPEIVHHPFFL